MTPPPSPLSAPGQHPAPDAPAAPGALVWLRRTHRFHVAAVLAACAAVYWPMLGASGLSSTEGHRAIPGWAMLHSGDWLRVTMFELGYLRKPPGMPWAIALSSGLLGETEFAARAVSALAATLMALLSYLFATRWFGRPWGLVAGLGCAMLPLLWSSGRAAEIEALNNLGTMASAFLLVELLWPARGRRVAAAGVLAAAGAAAIVVTALAKGPASAPVLGAVLAGACLAARSVGPLGRAWVWAAVALAAAALAGLGAVILSANDAPDTVRQGVSDFLWTRERAGKILTLIPFALGAAMPLSLGLVYALGRNLRAGRDDARSDDRAAAIAGTLAWAWVLALVVYTVAGVSNPRYVLPAAVLLPPLAAYAARELIDRPRPALMLGHLAVAAAVLAVIAAVLIPSLERQRSRASGRAAGIALGETIAREATGAGPVMLWADDVIETRPEVLHYAARSAGAAGTPLRPLWTKPAVLRGELPPPGAYLILKTDGAFPPEQARYAGAIAAGRLVQVAEERVHKFTFTLYRVAEAP